MKVYVINLDRHPDRLAHMRNQLSDVGFERVAAIDGARKPEIVSGLTRFELACLESHRVAWRAFLIRRDETACFLEDDVHLSPDFAALVGVDDWVPRDAHSIKLDTYLQGVKLGERRRASGSRDVAQLHSRHESSAAYILSREGAERYLAMTTSPVFPADYSLFPRNPRRLGLRVYQVTPAVAIQDHLLQHETGGSAFPTAMGSHQQGQPARSLFGKLQREASRIVGRAAEIPDRIYLRISTKLEDTTVEFG